MVWEGGDEAGAVGRSAGRRRGGGGGGGVDYEARAARRNEVRKHGGKRGRDKVYSPVALSTVTLAMIFLLLYSTSCKAP